MHEPDDKRVHQKEARSLVTAGGFDIVHVAPGDGRIYDLDGVRVITYGGGKTIAARLMKLPRLLRLAVAQRPDVYHCNEVESWLVGVIASLFTGAKVIFDAHEIYSHDFAESRFPPKLHRYVIAFVRGVYRILLLRTCRVVLAKASAAEDFKGVKTPLVLARNYAELSDTLPPEKQHTGRDSLTIIHLGAINRQRGWPQMLDALKLASNKTLKLRFLGRFGDHSKDECLARAHALGLADRVSVSDWVPYDQVMAEVSKADIGIILFQPVMHNFTHALPHKMFDYMLAGLPVVVPDFAVEVADNIRTSGAGITVDPANPMAVAEVLDRLADNPDLRADLGRKGRAAVINTFNWQKEAETLIAMYRALNAGG